MTLQPIGAHPDIATVFLGGCMWGNRFEVKLVLQHVLAEDFASPMLGTVVDAVRSLINADKPIGPQMVLDELRRTATFTPVIAKHLQDAATSGADTDLPLRHYGAALLQDSLRRRIESAGAALIIAATSAPEDALAQIVTNATTSIHDCLTRLYHLRGDAS
jgi:replicative DNA helicase